MTKNNKGVNKKTTRAIGITLNRIRNLERFLIGKSNTTRELLKKLKISFLTNDMGIQMYNKEKVWEHFINNDKIRKEIAKAGILSMTELEQQYQMKN